MRAPSLEKVCQWVTDAWSLITPDMIKKSFVSCGITAALDGSEDASIVCLRSDEMADAAKSLTNKTSALLIDGAAQLDSHQLHVDVDCEQDDENEGIIDLDGASDSES